MIAWVEANLDRLQRFLPPGAKLVIYVPIGIDGTFGQPRGAEPLGALRDQIEGIPNDKFPVIFFRTEGDEIKYAIIQAPKA